MSKIKVNILNIIFLLFLFGCSSKIAIPDLSGTDVDSSKIILANEGLIPVFEYQYSSAGYEEGLVISSDPTTGSSVEKNSKVLLIVSKGPKVIISKEALINWTRSFSSDDEWSFEAPRFEEGKIKIKVYPVVNSGKGVLWKEYGTATIDEAKVPIDFSILNNEITIPVEDLTDKTPNTIYVELYPEDDSRVSNVRLEFNIEW